MFSNIRKSIQALNSAGILFFSSVVMPVPSTALAVVRSTMSASIVRLGAESNCFIHLVIHCDCDCVRWWLWPSRVGFARLLRMLSFGKGKSTVTWVQKKPAHVAPIQAQHRRRNARRCCTKHKRTMEGTKQTLLQTTKQGRSPRHRCPN